MLTGGFTEEAKVNYKSVITVKYNLNKQKFDVYQINITAKAWYYADEPSIIVDRNDFSLTVNNKKIKFDCVFMCIAGSPGEDGKLQGYLDMIKMPYTGCSDFTSSALTMNKRMTVVIASFYGINVSKSVCVEKPVHNLSAVLQQVKLPVFVKANNGGSSIGASRVETINELPLALDKAFKEDKEVLIEEAIHGREFTIGVFKLKGKIDALPITEIISEKGFFDYEEKYGGKTKEITPAEINKSLEREIQRTAITIYEIMKCSYIARIDFIYNEKENKLYLLEVNTVPGLTDTSLVPQQVKKAGLTLAALFTAFIEEALNLRSTI